MIINTKSNLEGYPLILGRPWLETTHAYIGCMLRDMKISQGSFIKKLMLYLLEKSMMDLTNFLLISQYEGSDCYDGLIKPIFTIQQFLTLKEPSEGWIIPNFM